MQRCKTLPLLNQRMLLRPEFACHRRASLASFPLVLTFAASHSKCSSLVKGYGKRHGNSRSSTSTTRRFSFVFRSILTIVTRAITRIFFVIPYNFHVVAIFTRMFHFFLTPFV